MKKILPHLIKPLCYLHPVSRRRQRRVRRLIQTYGLSGMLESKENQEYITAIKHYWKTHLGRSVHPVWHLACKKICDIEDVRFIPNDVWNGIMLGDFNNLSMRPAFLDKNLSSQLFPDIFAPRTVLKRIANEYYDGANTWLTCEDALQEVLREEKTLIVKSSLTDNGVGVRGLEASGKSLFLEGELRSFADIESQYGKNFIIQERLSQHPILAEMHPASVNSIRIVTFRWRGKIRTLKRILRIGTEGRITDNASTGGLLCAIEPDGRLSKQVFDQAGKKYSAHPTTGFDFSQYRKLPGIYQAEQLVLEMHRRLYHFAMVSWDMVITKNGAPLFLEMNFRGAILLYQYTDAKPLFGDLTEDVLHYFRDKL